MDIMEHTAAEGGGERTIAAMSVWSQDEIGRKTLNFVRSCRRNPELWARIQARAAELRAKSQEAMT